jgi:hypothetical protein
MPKKLQKQSPNLAVTRACPRRFYIMRLPKRGRRFRRITFHRQVTQCLGSLQPGHWFLVVAKPTLAVENYPKQQVRSCTRRAVVGECRCCAAALVQGPAGPFGGACRGFGPAGDAALQGMRPCRGCGRASQGTPVQGEGPGWFGHVTGRPRASAQRCALLLRTNED